DMGFPAAFYGGSTANVAKMAENLGDPFALVSRGINVKVYPSCLGTHRAIDAMLHLIDLYDIKPEEVESVDCRTSPRYRKILFYDDATTGFEGKFSIPFVMAAALSERKVGLAQFTDDTVNDPIIKSLMKRVTCRVHPDWVEGKDTDSRPDVVIVKLKNGKELSHEIATPKGSPQIPLSEEELLTKYRECAKFV
ncbi:unnamed protein product, partial [marine sediment metagenome]